MMKKLTFIIGLFISVVCFGQVSSGYIKPIGNYHRLPGSFIFNIDSVSPKKMNSNIQFRDSFPPIPADVKFISISDMEKAINVIKDKISANGFDKIQEGINIGYQWLFIIAESEYNSKRKDKAIKVPVK